MSGDSNLKFEIDIEGLTKALQTAYFKAIKGQDPRYGHWLTNYKF